MFTIFGILREHTGAFIIKKEIKQYLNELNSELDKSSVKGEISQMMMWGI